MVAYGISRQPAISHSPFAISHLGFGMAVRQRQARGQPRFELGGPKAGGLLLALAALHRKLLQLFGAPVLEVLRPGFGLPEFVD